MIREWNKSSLAIKWTLRPKLIPIKGESTRLTWFATTMHALCCGMFFLPMTLRRNESLETNAMNPRKK
jgi:hypothetical protein